MIATPPPPSLEGLEIRAVRRDQRLPAQRYATWLYAGAVWVVLLVVTLSEMLTSPWYGLLLLGGAVGCVGIILPLSFRQIRRQRLAVDAHTLTSVLPFGKPRLVERRSIAALRLATATIATRGWVVHDMGGPVLLVLDGMGHCLRTIPAAYFTEADCRRLAEHLRVPITGADADCRSFAELAAEHPGAATPRQLRAGRWMRFALWLWAVWFVVSLVVLVIGIVRRDATPPGVAYTVTATNVAPIVNLPGAGTYRGTYTTSGCGQDASFAAVRTPNAARGQWNIGISTSAPLRASGDISATVTGSPNPVIFTIAPPGACQAWSLMLTWTSTTP